MVLLYVLLLPLFTALRLCGALAPVPDYTPRHGRDTAPAPRPGPAPCPAPAGVAAGLPRRRTRVQARARGLEAALRRVATDQALNPTPRPGPVRLDPARVCHLELVSWLDAIGVRRADFAPAHAPAHVRPYARERAHDNRRAVEHGEFADLAESLRQAVAR